MGWGIILLPRVRDPWRRSLVLTSLRVPGGLRFLSSTQVLEQDVACRVLVPTAPETAFLAIVDFGTAEILLQASTTTAALCRVFLRDNRQLLAAHDDL